jgi:tetratricopeptide (TPR) repeat protein
MRHKVAIICTLIVLFVGMCIVENSAVRARPSEPPSKDTSAIYALIGEFRVVFANLLWIKAENYHHEYLLHGKAWTSNKEMMGLIRLITILDPRFVEAYATGTYIYMDGYRDYPKAIEFLHEGLANNPRSWELHNLAAVMYAGRLHKPKQALIYARQAVRYCKDNFYRRRTIKLLHTIEKMAAETQKGSADQQGAIANEFENPSKRQL